MLVTLQKESGLLSRTDPTASTYNAAWGWHCPDTGPGRHRQLRPGLRRVLQPGLRDGQAVVPVQARPGASTTTTPARPSTSCGTSPSPAAASAPVTIQNPATASLYIYTPYQPNAASLAAYPGVGDAARPTATATSSTCSASTSGPPAAAPRPRRAVGGAGDRHHRDDPEQPVRVRGAGRPDDHRAERRRWPPGSPPGSARSACPTCGAAAAPVPARTTAAPAVAATSTAAAPTIGFDCSGLTAYVLGMAGYQTPGDSGSQRVGGSLDQLGARRCPATSSASPATSRSTWAPSAAGRTSSRRPGSARRSTSCR